MAGLIVVASDIPGAEDMRDMLLAYGFRSELRGYFEAILLGDPVALILSVYSDSVPVDDRVKGLRGNGYQGVIMVLGRTSPDLGLRQRLAEQKAWFLPAYSGPGDIVSRLRQML